MTTEVDVQAYSKELLFALRMREVPGPRIAEALAEVHSHVTETGENPREAFGLPKAYADQVRAALGETGKPPAVWRSVLTWTSAVNGFGAAVGAWFLIEGVLAFSTGERGSLGLPAAVSLLLGLALLVGLAVGLGRMARHSDVQVLDPRTGADMTPPLPRWVLPAMVTPPLLMMVLAVVVGLSQR